MQVQKSGIRIFGVAESFASDNRSYLCGVVMRRDLHIDGFIYGTIQVGGMDATDEILRMIQRLNRRDIAGIMLSGCIIAWYNIIDPERIHSETKIPVICVSYEDSEGLEEHIKIHFPGDEDRLSLYRNLGTRQSISLDNGHVLYARGYGLSGTEMEIICRNFTYHGKIPEPCRVARLSARALMHRELLIPDNQ